MARIEPGRTFPNGLTAVTGSYRGEDGVYRAVVRCGQGHEREIMTSNLYAKSRVCPACWEKERIDRESRRREAISRLKEERKEMEAAEEKMRERAEELVRNGATRAEAARETGLSQYEVAKLTEGVESLVRDHGRDQIRSNMVADLLRLGYRQADIANVMGISRQRVHQILGGRK